MQGSALAACVVLAAHCLPYSKKPSFLYFIRSELLSCHSLYTGSSSSVNISDPERTVKVSPTRFLRRPPRISGISGKAYHSIEEKGHLELVKLDVSSTSP